MSIDNKGIKNLTNTIIHKLTELFAKARAMRYFSRNLKSPAYGW